MRRTVWSGLAGGLAATLVTASLPSVERGALFTPRREQFSHPQAEGLSGEEVRLESTDGVTLHGWWLHGGGERVLIWFHGNGGNASAELENAGRFVRWFGLDVLAMDYRGYGQSTGTPTEVGLYADGRAIYRAVLERGFAPQNVVLFGRSLGAAVALELALEQPSAALAMEVPFLSFPAAARSHYPLLPPFIFGMRFDNERKISRLSGVPTLIVQAEKDDIVPPSHAKALYDLAPEPKDFYTLPGATHNDIYHARDAAYIAAFRRLIERVPAARRS